MGSARCEGTRRLATLCKVDLWHCRQCSAPVARRILTECRTGLACSVQPPSSSVFVWRYPQAKHCAPPAHLEHGLDAGAIVSTGESMATLPFVTALDCTKSQGNQHDRTCKFSRVLLGLSSPSRPTSL
eukprot:6385717-Amphidinium_carterae.1